MSELADFTILEGLEGESILALSGPYRVSSIGLVDDALRRIEGPISAIDLEGVTEIDTVGAWTACRLAEEHQANICLLYTSPSPRDRQKSRMPSSA